MVHASDGFRGLQLARREQPEVILLDVVLPGIDGFQLCRTLHRKSATLIAKEADELEGAV